MKRTESTNPAKRANQVAAAVKAMKGGKPGAVAYRKAMYRKSLVRKAG